MFSYETIFQNNRALLILFDFVYALLEIPPFNTFHAAGLSIYPYITDNQGFPELRFSNVFRGIERDRGDQWNETGLTVANESYTREVVLKTCFKCLVFLINSCIY